MNIALNDMKNQWESLGIQDHFIRVHHFSSNRFKSKPANLDNFYDWCKEREIKDENLQTVNRALKTAALIQQGKNLGLAIDSAWEAYPIVTR